MTDCLIAAGVVGVLVLILLVFQSAKYDEEIRQDKMYLFRKETGNGSKDKD